MAARGKDSLSRVTKTSAVSSKDSSKPSRPAAPKTAVQLHEDAPKYELHPRFAYGARELTPHSLAWLDERSLIFPIGRHMWRLDSHTLAMSFMCRRHQPAPPHVVVSKRRVAICETVAGGQQKAHMSLIDLTGEGKGNSQQAAADKSERKPPAATGQMTWKFSHPFIGSVRSCAMSQDGKLLAVMVVATEPAAAATTGAAKDDNANTVASGAATDADSSAQDTAAAAAEEEKEEAAEAEGEGTDNTETTTSAAATAADSHDEKIKALRAAVRERELQSGIALWRVDTHKLVASRQVPQGLAFLTICPDDNFMMCATGDKYIRCLKVVGGSSLEETPLLKRHREKTVLFRQHVWIGASASGNSSTSASSQSQTLAAVTEEEDGSTSIVIIFKNEIVQTIPRKSGKDSSGYVSHLAAFKDGFMLSTSAGQFALYRADPDRGGKTFSVIREIECGKGPISFFCMTPTQDNMAAIVRDYGVLRFPLSKLSSWNEVEQQFSDTILPCGQLVALAACEHRSLLVTSGVDNTVRVWEGIRNSQRLVKCTVAHVFDEVAHAVAIHPLGFHVILGFNKQLSAHYLLRNSLKHAYTIQLPCPIQRPLNIVYSHGGHKFAVSTGSHIFVYNSLNFALLQHIPGNAGVINSIRWSTNDEVIAAVTAEGAAYAWDLLNLARVQDHFDKMCVYHDLVLDWGRDWEKRPQHEQFSQQTSNNSAAADALAISNANAGSSGADIKSDKDKDDTSGGGRKLSSLGAQAQMRIKALTYNKTSTDLLGADLDHHQAGLPEELLEGDISYKLNANGFVNGTILAAGTRRDGFHRMRDVSENSLAREVSVTGDADFHLSRLHVTRLLLDVTRGVLIVGTKTGYLFLFAWPLKREPKTSSTICYARYAIHDGPITHLELMSEAGVLFSTGADGNMFVMDLERPQTAAELKEKERERKMLADKDVAGMMAAQELAKATQRFVGEANLSLVELNEYLRVMQENQRHDGDLKRTKLEAEGELRVAKEQFNNDLKSLQDDMGTALRNKDKEVEAAKLLVNDMQAQLRQLQAQHREEIRSVVADVSDKYEQQLTEQYQLYDNKCQELLKEQNARKQDAAEAERKYSQLVQFEAERSAAKEKEFAEKLSSATDERHKEVSAYEEAMEELEEEHDKLVSSIQQQNARKLAKNRESTAIAFAEMSAFRRKVESSAAAVTTLEVVTAEQKMEIAAMKQTIANLTAELQVNKAKVKEKEQALTKGQHALAAARKDNTVLQNFISLLEHRIAELEEREAPAVDYLITLKEQINEMNDELFEQNQQQRHIKEFAEKKVGQNTRLSSIVRNLREQITRKERRWNNVVKEMHHLINTTGAKDWEPNIRRFYQEYVAPYVDETDKSSGSSGGGGSNEEKDLPTQDKVLVALNRQRKHLEKQVEALRKSLKSLENRRKFESDKAVQRNTVFLSEVNELREQNKKLEMKCKQLLSLTQFNASLPQRLLVHVDDRPEPQLPLVAQAQSQAQSAASLAKSPSKKARLGAAAAASPLAPYSASADSAPAANAKLRGSVTFASSGSDSRRGSARKEAQQVPVDFNFVSDGRQAAQPDYPHMSTEDAKSLLDELNGAGLSQSVSAASLPAGSTLPAIDAKTNDASNDPPPLFGSMAHSSSMPHLMRRGSLAPGVAKSADDAQNDAVEETQAPLPAEVQHDPARKISFATTQKPSGSLSRQTSINQQRPAKGRGSPPDRDLSKSKQSGVGIAPKRFL